MKATIKLITTEKETINGFPIYVFLVHKGQRSKKCIGYSKAEFWDFENNIPLSENDNYNFLMPLILDLKAKCYKINFGAYNFMDAKTFLFGDYKNKTTGIFIEDGLKLCDTSRTGQLNQTILNSFNLAYPGVATSDITPKMVKMYMDALLRVNSANGVHTYIRKLSTIFNKISNLDNPFVGIRPKKQQTKQKNLTALDLNKISNTCTIKSKFDGRNTNETINYDRYYYMLMFYLGGIDMVDLASLRYDKHVINGRVEFNRQKGGTDVFVNNNIFEPAAKILAKFNCYPYLVPIYKYKDYHSFVNKMNNRFYNNTLDLNLSRKPLTKSARYTFINLAQQLLVDQRITMEIVGHSQKNTHSIYTDAFPLHVRDEAHKKIIDSIDAL